MDVISFLCESLGSSTVQLYDGLGSRRACGCSDAGFSSQNGTSAWGCTSEEQRSVFLGGPKKKKRNAKDIHKAMFPICGGKCSSKVVQS
jgi:hypothetical protein